MAGQQQVAGLDPALDLLPDLAVKLVRDEQHHDVTLGGGGCRIHNPEAVLLGLGDAGRVRTEGLRQRLRPSP